MKHVIKQSEFVRSWNFKEGGPVCDRFSADGWGFGGTAGDALEEDLFRRREVVQLDRGSERAAVATKAVALPSSPGAPLDEDGDAMGEKLPGYGPLQGFEPVAERFVVEVGLERLHPLVGAEADGVLFCLESSGMRGFA